MRVGFAASLALLDGLRLRGMSSVELCTLPNLLLLFIHICQDTIYRTYDDTHMRAYILSRMYPSSNPSCTFMSRRQITFSRR
jgi:hypothetical protein